MGIKDSETKVLEKSSKALRLFNQITNIDKLSDAAS